ARRAGTRGGGRRPARADARLRVGRLFFGVLLLLRLDLAQPRDTLLMLVEALGKAVPAGAVGDEEKLLGARRVGGGFERRAAWVGDRSRRQAVDHIRVVPGLEVDIRARDRTAEAAFAADDAVDDRRVRLQLHALLETIDEHGRDPGALLGLAGF